MSNVQAQALLAACRDQEGPVDTQLLQTAASGCAELMSSDLRLFKTCPELQSASSASSSCGPLSLSEVLGSQQRQGTGSPAVTPDSAAVMDSQAWSRQNVALELALRDYMHAEEGFGQAHTEVSAALAVQYCQGWSWIFSCLCLPSYTMQPCHADLQALERWTAAPAASGGAALGHNVATACAQHCMMRRLLDALGLVQQAHTQICAQSSQARGELHLRQQVQLCMDEGSRRTSMQAGIMSAETQPCSYSEILKVL